MWKYLRAGLIVGPRIICTLLFKLNRYAKHPERYPLEKRYKCVRNLIIHIMKAFRPEWRVEGLEKYKELTKGGKKVLLVGNHASFNDALSIIALSEEPIAFVAKVETKKMFVVGKAAMAIDCLFMDRADLRQSLKVIREASQRLKDGVQNILIFPEGTRRKEIRGPLNEMHPGSLKAGTLAGVPILTFAALGNYRVLSKNYNFRRHPIQYRFLETYLPEDYKAMDTTVFIEKIRENIQKNIYEMLKIDDEYIAKKYHRIPLRKGPLLEEIGNEN
ncbi:MAG: 1-acyl-sn-glycerol-3-phosphate acyltransferase [Bacilli bacterium]|nr:1-acyl-sn-glycerol-3-phosphate acyltransferase [Bacilli bacterium]